MATEEIPASRSLVVVDSHTLVAKKDILLGRQAEVIAKYLGLLQPDPERIVRNPELDGKVIVETTRDGKDIFIVSTKGLIRLPQTLHWITEGRYNYFLAAAAKSVEKGIASGYRQKRLLGVLPHRVVYLDGVRQVEIEAVPVQFDYSALQADRVLSWSFPPVSVQIIDPDQFQKCREIAEDERQKEAMEEYRSFFQPASDMAVVDRFEATLASQFEPPENIFKFDLIHHNQYEDRWITAHLVRVPEEELEAAKTFNSHKMPGRPVIHLACPQKLRQDFFGKKEVERRNIDRLRKAIYQRHKIPSDLHLDIKFID